MKDSELRTRAREFAVDMITACDKVNTKNGRGVLVNQVIRSATSIGANLHEANYAQSKADFVSKLQIALKECFETEYWIDLMQSVGCVSCEDSKKMLNDCGIIRKMLVKSINTAKSSGV